MFKLKFFLKSIENFFWIAILNMVIFITGRYFLVKPNDRFGNAKLNLQVFIRYCLSKMKFFN